jgi:MFS family permease
MEHGSIEGGTNTAHEKSETDVEKAADTPQKPDDSSADPNLVDWDGKDDPENPQNYSNRRKWAITLTMSSMTVWITFASSVFSTATLVTAKEFNVSTEIMVLGTSLVVFGFALGPLCWAPLSELYGRRIPLFSGYLIFAIFQIPVAVAKNLETILVCRFLMGVFGCSPLAVVGGALADIWNPVDRAVAIALFSSATFMGPVLGPIM